MCLRITEVELTVRGERKTFFERGKCRDFNLEHFLFFNINDAEIIKDFYFLDENEFKEKYELKVSTVDLKDLKLFLIETDLTGWDIYKGAVACAYDENDAIEVAVEVSKDFKGGSVKEIGIAAEGIKRGVILTDFLAG